MTSADNGLTFPNVGKSNITVGPGITFSTWGDGKFGIYFNNPIGPLNITGNTFSKNDATLAETNAIRILYANASADLADVEISDNTFNLNQYTTAFVLNLTTSSGSYKVHDVDYIDNIHGTVNYGFRFLNATGATWTLPQGLIPYNINIDRNYFTKTYRAAIGTGAGIVGTDGSSSISYNTIIECGDASSANVNCLQLHYINGVDVVGNTINSIDTSVCDGSGIILDWAKTDDNYISDGNYVAGNTIKNANAACGGKGISVFKGKNNTIVNNLVDGVTYGKAYRVASNESTGNVFYNNTARNADVCFSQTDADTIGQNVTWINNLCDAPTSKGFEALNNSTATESHNLVYNAPANDITLDSTDLTVNPRLNAKGYPKNYSLYELGTNVGLPYAGKAAPIGFIEMQPGSAGIPGKPWSVIGGSFGIGIGEVHSIGQDYFVLLEIGDYILLENGDKIILEQ